MGLPFEVVVSDVDEDSPETDPARLAAELAALKARAVAQTRPQACVIGSDTVVALGGQLLAKPASEAENAEFIRALAGQTHQVYTGVCIVTPTGEHGEVERTDVTFRPLQDAEIAYYARSGEGLDKAGGYGIQGLGMALIARIEGDYSNVVGFPLGLVTRLLRGAGYTVWNLP